MANYIFTNKAVEDLSKIWDYTYEVWSEEQADKYYCQLLDYCQSLANNQSLGKKYEKISKELLGYRANQHIVFYRKLKTNDIEILRILHCIMNLKNRIEEL